MKLNKGNKVFMIGIGGSGMRALALLLKSSGLSVSGADRDFKTLETQKGMQGYTIMSEEDSIQVLSDADVVVYSDAVVKDHPLRKYAVENNIPTLAYQEALGDFASNYKVIAVTGTHGKSSTTALLAHILIENGIDPSVLIGASMPAWDNQNAKSGESDYFILEADEYREHFLTLNPLYAIITTIDFDHPDYYKDLEHVKESYNRFIEKIEPTGCLVVSAELVKEHPRMNWHINTVSPSDSFDISDIELALPGEHMKGNALLAITIATKLGIDPVKAANSLKSFRGLGRRFELLGEYRGMEIVSDYGHHPREIAVTLEAAKSRYLDKNIVVVLEIHMPDRLERFYDEFLDVLKEANTVVFAPVFVPKGREKNNAVTNALLEKLKSDLFENDVIVEGIDDYDNLKSTLRALSRDFDVALCFSAGVLDSKLRDIT